MGLNIHLLLHNIISVLSIISTLGLAFFTFLNGPHRRTNIVFSCLFLSVTVFIISHVIGVNITDPILSEKVLMFNLVVFLIGALQMHSVLLLVGKDKEYKWFIFFVYIASLLFIALFLLLPDLYLLPSLPKMYFPNYYVAGYGNWIHIGFLHGVILLYCMYVLFIKYHECRANKVLRNQYKYFIIALFVAYVLAFIPNLLIYDIQVDPLWGMFFAILFVIPFGYGAIKYEFLSIKVIAREALLYSTLVVMVGGVIILLNSFNQSIRDLFPFFPVWIVPLVSSIMVVSIGVLIWRNLRENDILKYQFISIVTHKFRAPMTSIKWAAENLSNPNLSEVEKTSIINNIKNYNEKLVQLTNILTNISVAEDQSLEYRLERGNLSRMTEEVLVSITKQFEERGIILDKNIENNIYAMLDEERIKFIILVLLENALQYSKKGGTVYVILKAEEGDAVLSVKDDGIGMSKEQVDLIFSKFYRADQARKSDTEGMGVSLYITKRIIEKYHGKISASSDGLDKGSTFSLSLPISTPSAH